MKPVLGHGRRLDVVFYMPGMGPLLVGDQRATAGGAETQILLLARELAARGRAVGIVSTNPNQRLPADFDGVRIFVQRRFDHLPRGPRLLFHLAETMKVLTEARGNAYVQRAAGVETGLVGLVARLYGQQFVYSSASVVDFDFGRLERSRLKLLLYHLGIRLSSQIVVQTSEQVALCRHRFGRESTMIRSVADAAPVREGTPAAFLWIGRLSHYKRPDVFIELARAVPNATFWMLAVPTQQPGGEELERLRRETAPIENLKILEPRPRPEVMELIDRAVAVVNTADYEGMPNIFLEGWARGVPALAYKHDPDGIVERHGLGEFAHGSPERLAQAAREMWGNRAEQTDLARRCRDYVALAHSLHACADAWEEVLGLTRENRSHPPPDGDRTAMAAGQLAKN